MSIYYNTNIVSSGLVLYLDAANSKSYPGTGTAWNDLIGNANNGTLINGPIYNSDNGGSFVFDGSNDYVNCGNNLSIQLTTNITTECWIYLSSYTSDWVRIIGTGGNGGNRTFGLWYHGPSGRLLWQRYGATDPFIYPTSPISPILNLNTWNHVVATTDGSSHAMYLNGSLIGTATAAGPWPWSNENVTIGFAGYHTYHNGRISNCKIYNRALTITEIRQNYNALRGRYSI